VFGAVHVRGGARPDRKAVSIIFSLVVVAAAVPAHAAALKSIRSSAGSGYTRIVIDLSAPITYEYATLPATAGNSARLYVDLQGVKLGGGDHDVWIGDMRVKRVRTGQFSADTARIVLELEGPVTPKIFQLEEPPRLVIDLSGVGAAPTARSAPHVAPPSQGLASRPVTGPVPQTLQKASPPPVAVAVAKAPAPRPAPSAPVHVGKAPAPSPARVGTARPVKIVIDAGHGGRDPGARNPAGVTEKYVVFDISRRLADKLRRGLGVEIHMSRTADKYIGLEDRKDLANKVDADLFVSIHANASENEKLHGIETYYLKNTNDRATLRLARLENGVDLLIKGGDVSTDADLSYILSDMVQGQKEADSILLANHMQSQLVGYLNPKYRSVNSLGVKQGPFMVLDGTFMPSVLCEVGFITHATEGQRLATAAYREAIAEGLYRGLKHFLEDERIDDLR
jgi:N-acetylmuramoyl-L-alanine amidase